MDEASRTQCFTVRSVCTLNLHRSSSSNECSSHLRHRTSAKKETTHMHQWRTSDSGKCFFSSHTRLYTPGLRFLSGSAWYVRCSRTTVLARKWVPGTCCVTPDRSTDGPPTVQPGAEWHWNCRTGRGRCCRDSGLDGVDGSPWQPWLRRWGGRARWSVLQWPGTWNKLSGRTLISHDRCNLRNKHTALLKLNSL